VATDAHGYETQYLLSSPDGSIDVAALRAAIVEIGDSVVVAGDQKLVRVHVHGVRPDLAIAAGLRWGRLSQVDVIDLDDQVAHHGSVEPATGTAAARKVEAAPGVAAAMAMVAVTRAPGLARVLESLGARVVKPAHGTRPSVGEIVEGILAVGSGAVIVLPNDRDALLAAGQAATLAPLVEVEVIPTRNAAEGIAAAVAFDPTASLPVNVERMTAESSELRSFTVITAAKDSVVDGRPVRQGQVIALDAARNVLAIGADVEAVTLQALAGYEDFELITIYRGDSEGPDRGRALVERIELAGWTAQVEIVEGGQLHDHLLVAVE
jgi:dihydroxyacetone kinase-like predicted kinase